VLSSESRTTEAPDDMAAFTSFASGVGCNMAVAAGAGAGGASPLGGNAEAGSAAEARSSDLSRSPTV